MSHTLLLNFIWHMKKNIYGFRIEILYMYDLIISHHKWTADLKSTAFLHLPTIILLLYVYRARISTVKGSLKFYRFGRRWYIWQNRLKILTLETLLLRLIERFQKLYGLRVGWEWHFSYFHPHFGFNLLFCRLIRVGHI